MYSSQSDSRTSHFSCIDLHYFLLFIYILEEPFQVLNLDTLIQMHLKWLSYLPRVKPFYAVKCNSTETVLRTLNALGTGFDCASKGEISQVLSLGVKPENIIYAHTTKPQSHIKYACAQGVNLMTFDDEEELRKVSRCHPKAKLVLRIAVDDSSSFYRLSSKFGAGLSTTGRLLECAAELGLEVVGVSFHIGSKCSQSLAFRQAIADARSVFDTAKLLGFQFSLLDIGGGFSGKDFPFSEVINGALDEYFPFESGVQIIAEPGRYYAETTFTLAANVIAKRVIMEDMRKEGVDTISQAYAGFSLQIPDDMATHSISSVTSWAALRGFCATSFWATSCMSAQSYRVTVAPQAPMSSGVLSVAGGV
uniref:ornithine decarboxylase n=1 Tax=Takifugu rubripes TaxID=31033 RepID=A0A674P6T6_TAKRU